MSTSMRNNFVNVLLEELGKARGDVLQLSSELNSKVQDIGFEKVEKLCKRLRADVEMMKKEYDVLNTLVRNAPRDEVLTPIEAKLAANDNILDFVEDYLQKNHGLDPVQVPAHASPTIHSIGLRRGIFHGGIVYEDEENYDEDTNEADGLKERGDILHGDGNDEVDVPLTPAMKPSAGLFHDIRSRPPILASMGITSASTAGGAGMNNNNNKNNDDYDLPPTPTLNSVGITNTNIGSLYASKLTFSSAETPVHQKSTTSHVLQTATSPAQDEEPSDDGEDDTYHEEIAAQMEKIGLNYKDR